MGAPNALLHSVYSQQARSKKEQWTEGTHRLEDPVSNRTVKFCGGVPMLITPKY